MLTYQFKNYKKEIVEIICVLLVGSRKIETIQIPHLT